MINVLSVVVSVYNEESVLPQFYSAVQQELNQLPCEWELVFVNDGSQDASASLLNVYASEDPRVKVIHFSRNYGHEAAMIAGIDYASGDGVVCMDADLQHPVECLPQILEKFNQGYEIITMVRTANKKAPLWKKITSAVFYKVLNSMSEIHFDENASDFFALTRQPAQVLRDHFRETRRYIRAYVQSIGFRKTSIEYRAKERAAGESKYNFRMLLRTSISALLSTSRKPLRLPFALAAVTGIGCLVALIFGIIYHGSDQALLIFALAILCFLFALLFVVLGIIGEYLLMSISETSGRPIYTVRETVNMGADREGGKENSKAGSDNN